MPPGWLPEAIFVSHTAGKDPTGNAHSRCISLFEPRNQKIKAKGANTLLAFMKSADNMDTIDNAVQKAVRAVTLNQQTIDKK